MASEHRRKKVPGSDKQLLPQARLVGEVEPNERLEITVMLRPRSHPGVDHRKEAMNLASQPPEKRQYVRREEFDARRGADPADLEKIEEFAHQHNLTVVEMNTVHRSVRLSGSAADMMDAFRPNLKRYRIGEREFRGRTGGITVPHNLADIVVGVFGLDDRPVAKPHLRMLNGAGRKEAAGTGGSRAIRSHSVDYISYTPPQIADLYNFPTDVDGKGQCIAIVELNDFDRQGNITGSGFRSRDLTAYFKTLGLPRPRVTAVGVDGGANKPGLDPNADAEVMLDIEVAGAVAPRSKIAVYFAPNTDKGFLDAINTALHDNFRKPSVISISWGGPEDSWTRQALNAFDQVLQDASMLGVTVCCAAGDDGSSDIRDPQARDGRPHVDFPASSPFALACGGTRLTGSGNTITSEVVWNEGSNGATGGGVSNFFTRPEYQTGEQIPRTSSHKAGRGVPDVAADADPVTGYQVRLVGGQRTVIGGTSAVAPLWSGLIALINQRLSGMGKPTVGFMNPLLYHDAEADGIFHDITEGNNDITGIGKYKARKGWDACTGLGSPDGTRLMAGLGG